MAYELLGEWDRDVEWPVYGLVQPEKLKLSRITINRFGPDYGSLVWQISATYEAGRERALVVHTVLRRVAISSSGESRTESGVREAKGLVAAHLGVIPEQPGARDSYWESTNLPISGIVHPAERLPTSRGAGWVVDLGSVVIGLVGFDPGRDSIGRIHPATLAP